MTIATSSDGGALATVTTTATTPVSTAPRPLSARRPRQPDPRTDNQWRTMPLWLIVNDTNTPTEYSGISACVSPANTTSSVIATADRMRIPAVKARRSPLNENWRGMNPSWARMAARRGNAL